MRATRRLTGVTGVAVDLGREEVAGRARSLRELDAMPAEAGGAIARLRRWLYGARPAARAWEEYYAANLASIGFVRGLAVPTVFLSPEWDVATSLH